MTDGLNRSFCAPRIIAIDGHDGTGKTSMTRALAAAFGGLAVRPFSDSLGDHIAWLLKNGDFSAGSRLAQSAVLRMQSLHPDSSILWMDRHWASIYVDLPSEFWGSWQPLPTTIFLDAPAATMIARCSSRGETPGPTEEFESYRTKFHELARKFDVPTFDTENVSVEQTLHNISALIRTT